MIVEVHNTHGERHLYTPSRRDRRGGLRASRWTRSSTSRRSSRPAGRYTVSVRDEASRLRITINEDHGDGARCSHTSLDLARRRADRPNGPAHARPPSVGDAQDDRDDPLARPAAVAARRAIPSSLRGAHDDASPATARAAPAARRTRSCPRLAGRIAIAAAARIKVGHLMVVLPDGDRRTFGDAGAEPARRDPHPRPAAPCKLLVGGETGGGEAYMDGLWSSPDLAGLLRWAALNREALALSTGWFRRAGAAAADDRPSVPPQHEAPEPPQHPCPLRPRQRLLPDLPRRDDDLLERGLRVARPVARRRAAQQVPAHRRGRRPGPRQARARDRHRLGRLRAVRGRRARLPRDVDHDLAGAVRPGPRAGPRGRAGATSSTSSCATTATSTGTYDAIVSIEMLEAVGAEYFATFFEACDAALVPGRPAEPPVDHVPRRRLRAPATRRELDPDVHLPGRPVPVAGRHRAVARATRGC